MIYLKVIARGVLILIGLSFLSCKDNSSQLIEGTWKVVKEENLLISLVDIMSPVERHPNEYNYYTFFKDSMMLSHYPFYNGYLGKYRIVDEQEIINQSSFDGTQLFSMRFSGDTLILKSRRAKHYEDLYLLKANIDKNQIDLLKSSRVDWKYFQKKWNLSDEDNYDPSLKHEIGEFPVELNLTIENSSNYNFDKDILNYWENDSLIQFRFFSTNSDKIYLSLEHVCDIQDCRYTRTYIEN